MITPMPQQPSRESADNAALAADPATRGAMLWRLGLRYFGSRRVTRALAANPRLPRSLLWLLVIRKWDVRAAVGANPRCPRPLMRLLTFSSLLSVNTAVAGNPAASARLLDFLTRVSSPCIRMSVAANPSLPGVLADRLLGDKDPYVRGVAAAHPVASAAGLCRLAAEMTEPAWTLRRIAANPACPAEQSDQLLTWIALGGTGNADPTFDPVECMGHPGDTSVPLLIWYHGQGAQYGAAEHPLWRVRAAVLSARGKVSRDQAWTLARDPRPEVRRTIARAPRLSLNLQTELRGDADEVTVRLALAPHERPRGLRIPVVVGILVPLFVAALGVVQATRNSPAEPGPALVTPAPLAAYIMSSHQLPGGGTASCGILAGAAPVNVIQVSAGSRRLVVRIDGAVQARNVVPGGDLQLSLRSVPSWVTVSASSGGQSPVFVVSEGICA
jgi:hypothetical protein